MPRQPRLDNPGLLQHVIVRGIERRNIFRNNADRLDFGRSGGHSILSPIFLGGVVCHN